MTLVAVRPPSGRDPDPRCHYLHPDPEPPEAVAGGGIAARNGLLRWLPAPLRRRLAAARHASLVRELEALVRDGGITRLYAATGDLPGLLAAETARRCRLPLAVSVHAADVLPAKYGDATLSRAETVFVCNRRVHDLLLQRSPALADRLQLIHHGIDVARWPFGGVTWQPHDPLRLLFVGRLVARKRVDRAVEAVAQLRRDGIAAELVVVGEGPQEATARRQAEAAGLTDSVQWRGVLPPDGVREAMADADLLLVPSAESDHDMEGIPNVILEAMAAGLPVMAASTGSIPEVLTERTGLPVPDDGWLRTPQILQPCLRHPHRLTPRLRAARQLVERHFNAPRLLEQKLQTIP